MAAHKSNLIEEQAVFWGRTTGYGESLSDSVGISVVKVTIGVGDVVGATGTSVVSVIGAGVVGVRSVKCGAVVAATVFIISGEILCDRVLCTRFSKGKDTNIVLDSESQT